VTETLRWRLLLSYDGSGYRGFAVQPSARTIAGELAAALARLTRSKEAPVITCAGRTDAGVHARGQVVHVDLPAQLPILRRKGGAGSMEAADLVSSLNRQLAPSLVVRKAELAPPDFDARRSATARSYRYLVWNAAVPDPLLAALSWHVPDVLAVRAMKSAADSLVGEHDFRAFCRRAPGRTANEPILRRVLSSTWDVADDAAWMTDGIAGLEGAGLERGRVAGEPPGLPVPRLLRFDIEAQSFCHQMVRSLVAALVDVGLGRSNTAHLVTLLKSTVRDGAPRPAPAHGLCLMSVSYDS